MIPPQLEQWWTRFAFRVEALILARFRATVAGTRFVPCSAEWQYTQSNSRLSTLWFHAFARGMR